MIRTPGTQLWQVRLPCRRRQVSIAGHLKRHECAAPEVPRTELAVAIRGVIEEQTMRFSRITVDPRQMGGVPCIRRLRIPVATVVGMVAEGMTREEILVAYPDLKLKDIGEALRYAAEAVRERELPLRPAS